MSVIVDRWSERMQMFSQRNRGSIVVMRFISMASVTEPAAQAMMLQAVEYNERTDCAQITLHQGHLHLFLTVTGIASVYLMPATAFRGDILTIEHDAGQTILEADGSMSVEG